MDKDSNQDEERVSDRVCIKWDRFAGSLANTATSEDQAAKEDDDSPGQGTQPVPELKLEEPVTEMASFERHGLETIA